MDEVSHEPLVQAETDLDDRADQVQARKRPGQRDRTGELDALAARGGLPGVDVDALDTSERTPLIPSSRQRKNGDDEDAEGEREFSFGHLPWTKRPSYIWVFVPFAILALAYGGIIAPRVNLIINLLCREYLDDQKTAHPGLVFQPILLDGNNDACLSDEVEKRSTLFTLYCNLIAGLLSAFTSPKLGALSDRYGRTKIIALTSLGSLFADAITIVAALRPDVFSTKWILVGFALDGLCGSFTTAFALVHAYVSDCVPGHSRNVVFGYFHGLLFTGIAIGPILTGLISKWTGTPLTAFYIMLGVHIFFVLFLSLVVPESLTEKRQTLAREKHAVLKSERSTDWIENLREINILEPLRILWPAGPRVNPQVRTNMLALAAVDTIMFGVAMGSVSITLIYVKNQFHWDTYMSGVLLSATNSSRVFCLVVLLPALTWFFRTRRLARQQRRNGGTAPKRDMSVVADAFDVNIIRVAVLFDTLGFLGITLARKGWVFILSGVVAAVGGMGSPTISSALTRHVPAESTGQLLGAMGLLHALARVIAPTLFSGIYAATIKGFRQTVWVCLTATFGLAFLCTWFVRPGVSTNEIEVEVPRDEEEPLNPRSQASEQ